MPGLLLLALLPSAPAAYTFPARDVGDAQATLTVEVADKPAAPGQGRVALTLTVEGPPELEVEPASLEEAVPAWKVRRAASAYLLQDSKLVVSQVLDLVQLRPGPAPLPVVRLRVRTGSGPWHESTWRDLLRQPRDFPDVQRPPPLPPPLWPRILRWGAALLAGALLLSLAVLLFRRPKRAPRQQTPAERALEALADLQSSPPPDAREHHARLSAVIRTYLAEQFGVPALQLTTPSLDEHLRSSTPLSAALRERLGHLLQACDLVKFAGLVPSPAECAERTGEATALVREAQAEAALMASGGEAAGVGPVDEGR